LHHLERLDVRRGGELQLLVRHVAAELVKYKEKVPTFLIRSFRRTR
jgi:hypothetical protein